MRQLCGLVLLMLVGCATNSVKVRPFDVGTEYVEVARVMPINEAKDTLDEVLHVARGDSPNRTNNPMEHVDVTETSLEVLALCYDAKGNTMGRTPLKRTYRHMEPRAYKVTHPDEPTVYFVKLNGAYTGTGSGFRGYPNLQSECIWFANASDVVALFETITCLKEAQSSLQ